METLTPTGTGSTNTTQRYIRWSDFAWNGLNLDQRPNFTQTNQGGVGNFQFSGKLSWIKSLSNHTIIQRTTTIQSVTDTTSTFTQ